MIDGNYLGQTGLPQSVPLPQLYHCCHADDATAALDQLPSAGAYLLDGLTDLFNVWGLLEV
jgi:hypothetical protein